MQQQPTRINVTPTPSVKNTPIVATTTAPSYYLELLLLLVLGAPALFFGGYALVQVIAGAAAAGSPATLYLGLPSAVFVLAAAVIFLSNPMHALLALIGVFLSTVFFYLALGAEFLGLIFLIVYVGAVAILFIFVIMLLNVKALTRKASPNVQTAQLVGSVLAILLVKMAMLDVSPALSFELTAELRAFGLGETAAEALSYFVTYRSADVQSFASLYGEHSALFVIVTVVLLGAMIGAIVLATATLEGEATPLPEQAPFYSRPARRAFL